MARCSDFVVGHLRFVPSKRSSASLEGFEMVPLLHRSMTGSVSCVMSTMRAFEDHRQWRSVMQDFVRVDLPGSRTWRMCSLQRRRTGSRRCASYDKSHASAVVVSDEEEVVRRPKELLERQYLDHGIQDLETTSREDGVRKSKDEKMFLGHPLSYNMIRFEEEDLVEDNRQRRWWDNLDQLRRAWTPHTRGIILLNMLTFLYGSNIAIVKSAGATLDPSLFSVGRFSIASLAFAPFLTRAVSKKNLRQASVELGLLASAGYLTQCVSLLTSDASRVSFISTFTVIVVPLFAALSGAKVTKITWFAAATAIFGVALLECNGKPFDIGDVWSFVSAVVFGVHMLRTESHSRKLAPEDSLPVMSLQLVVITVCSGLWSCASHVSSGDFGNNFDVTRLLKLWHEAGALPWLPMLYTGLLSTAFCLWSELVSLRDVQATEAAVIYTTEPLWGAAFAWISLGERWGPNGWLGAFLILGGSLTIQLFGRPETPDSTPPKVVIPVIGIDRLESSSEDDDEQPKKQTKGVSMKKSLVTTRR